MQINELELFIFDLDGTITKSRSDLSNTMAEILKELLSQKKVVVISGADFNQFQKQLIKFLPKDTLLKNLYIAPLTGGSLYYFQKNSWIKLYEDTLKKEEKLKVITILKRTLKDTALTSEEKIFGKQIQDRGGQITFSALGDEAPLEIKKNWDPDIKKRKEFKRKLNKDLSEFEISIGGTTSIDIRKKGIDKAFGINKISSLLSIPKEKIIFFGDAIFEGGNDYSATTTGVKIQKVKNPEETLEILKKLLAKNSKH